MNRVIKNGVFVMSILASCGPMEPEADYGDPTNPTDGSVQDGLFVQVIAPRAGEVLSEPVATLILEARNEDADRPVTVRVGPLEGQLRELQSAPDGFSTQVTLAHGRNTYRVQVVDDEGGRVREVRHTILYDGNAPGARIDGVSLPNDEGCSDDLLASALTASGSVCVRGTASATSGSTPTGVAVEGASTPVAEDGTFAIEATLEPNTVNTVVVEVVDAAGRRALFPVLVQQDAIAPTLDVVLPANVMDGRTSERKITLAGTVTDDIEVASLRVEDAQGGVTYIDIGPDWSFEWRLEPGINTAEFVAEDLAGNETRIPVDVIRDRVISLRAQPGSARQATLQLDRFALEELFDEDAQRDVELVSVPLRATMGEGLRRLREPERFGIDTSSWGDAEWNLFRLLNMTPDTANLNGTALEEVLEIANALGLPAPRLTAEFHDIGTTEPFLPTDLVADAILRLIVATHPNAVFDEDGEVVVPVTMYDVFQNLETLGERFGPVGDHPGFLDSTSADLFEPGFLFILTARTNLQEFEGVDASADTKDVFFVAPEGQVLEFDFLDPETFDVIGLVDEPAINLRYLCNEYRAFLAAGTEEGVGEEIIPGFPVGNSAAWDIDPWFIERVVAEAAYTRYAELYAAAGYSREFRYSTGAIDDAAVASWNRGWLDIRTAGGIGNPPSPVYIWDTLNEVAQVRLHDGGLREGEANVAIELTNIPVGLDSEALIEALRPSLEEQQEDLSSLLIGTSALSTSNVDLFYVADERPDRTGYLFFVAPEDVEGEYGYSRPGFYSDSVLAQKISSTGPTDGIADSIHEKVPVSEGSRVFFADDEGTIFRMDVVSASSEGVDVLVSRVGELP